MAQSDPNKEKIDVHIDASARFERAIDVVPNSLPQIESRHSLKLSVARVP
jgi:hypothetical protein